MAGKKIHINERTSMEIFSKLVDCLKRVSVRAQNYLGCLFLQSLRSWALIILSQCVKMNCWTKSQSV